MIRLAAVATALLMAVTNQITHKRWLSYSFLWVLPLTIYLLMFILAFIGGKLLIGVMYILWASLF